MKKILLTILVCASFLVLTQCKKEDNDPAKKEERKPSLKDFSLSQNNISLFKDAEHKIAITSGNDDYTLEQSEESKKIAQISLSADKKEIVIKALIEGKIVMKITDIPTKKEVSLDVFVSSKVTPEDYELSPDKKTLVKWNGENVMRSFADLRDAVIVGIVVVGHVFTIAEFFLADAGNPRFQRGMIEAY